MKKVIGFLAMGIVFITLETSNEVMNLVSHFLGGIGIGSAVHFARMFGRTESETK